LAAPLQPSLAGVCEVILSDFSGLTTVIGYVVRTFHEIGPDKMTLKASTPPRKSGLPWHSKRCTPLRLK
jgi:hypothetical protein